MKNILELVKSGFVSDPPGIPFYYCPRIHTVNHLPVYHCWCGTHFVEGGVHWPIRCSLPIGGVSPRHTSTYVSLSCLAVLLDNESQVGTYNMTRKHYKSHFDLWLLNERQHLLNSDLTQELVPGATPLAGWVNGDLYVQTTEVFGILPVPSNVQTSAGMLPFDPTNIPPKHGYLARKQGTLYAVLTVHPAKEATPFSEFRKNDSADREPHCEELRELTMLLLKAKREQELTAGWRGEPKLYTLHHTPNHNNYNTLECVTCRAGPIPTADTLTLQFRWSTFGYPRNTWNGTPQSELGHW